MTTTPGSRYTLRWADSRSEHVVPSSAASPRTTPSSARPTSGTCAACPRPKRRRLLDGDWDFDDDDSVLFKLHLLQTADTAPDDQQTYCGCDPSLQVPRA